MDYLIGDIHLFPYGFVPEGWFQCAGQTLHVMQYQVLYSLIGTKFGGSGQTTFMLPNLQGAEPVPGMNYYIATQGIYPQRS